MLATNASLGKDDRTATPEVQRPPTRRWRRRKRTEQNDDNSIPIASASGIVEEPGKVDSKSYSWKNMARLIVESFIHSFSQERVRPSRGTYV
ncbi:hypothetical protein IV203_036687 [Nitzschia inconspicua]|uniref:Uncharacterized protein n=1 Tax=Nitzschia inconspicua TaxID=303405 RepID=A0A9K3KZD3_9STRA|nr:hypothetical protein IV203_008272 [Nitzschia inconspicua]KAG7352226.1 hypothetical protein IV203_008274 [Nitzschia inconspicua]KAG7361586.1 hypothetical protein IV203_036687 [Nitzschia inconspicua]